MSANTIYENGTYLAKHPSWHEEDSSWKAMQIIRMLKKNKINPTTICEVGCGAGEILNSLVEYYGSNVYFSGYEISPQAFEICQKKVKLNLHYFLKDLLDERDAFFDIVMAIDVFEHVEDYIGFIRRLRTKGTYKIFHIPLDLSVQSVLRSSPLGFVRKRSGHLHYFTKETALATLKDAGYEILDCIYTSGSVELPVHNWKAKLIRFPRKLFFAIHQDLAVRILGGFSLLVLAK
jgi:cyclopropane fatty-acyl-phospholipid synthase-like methyltransferase